LVRCQRQRLVQLIQFQLFVIGLVAFLPGHNILHGLLDLGLDVQGIVADLNKTDMTRPQLRLGTFKSGRVLGDDVGVYDDQGTGLMPGQDRQQFFPVLVMVLSLLGAIADKGERLASLNAKGAA
jgi:hypothetical protein